MTTEPIDQLASALAMTGQAVSGVQDAQWALPTPCTEWTVKDLVEHVIDGNRRFAAALGDEPPHAPQPAREAGGDLAAAYEDSSRGLVQAFRRPGALDMVVSVPVGSIPGFVALHLRLTEVLVHGWDLVRATGQPAAFPDDLVEIALAFTRANLANIPPERRPFSPPKPVDDDAPAIDRLAACLGRDVAAAASSRT